MRAVFVYGVCALLFGGLALAALAEDVQPPWWRGQVSTTSQVWEFSTPQENPIPPDGPARGGQPPLPSTNIVVEAGPNEPWNHWLEMDHPYEYHSYVGLGVWPLSGYMDVTVDNHNPPNEKKWVWLQLTWRPQDPGEVPILTGFDPAPVAPPLLIAETPIGPDWRESTYFWEIRPNPVDERFGITGTINVDEVVIDTWCVPEPGALALLAVGGLCVAGLAWHRWRK
jgi:hypothetical protein